MSGGRIYAVTTGFQAVAAIQDLFEIKCPANTVLRLLTLHLGQSSDAGDTEAEQLQVLLKWGTGTFTSGSGGAAVTPVQIQREITKASGMTVERNNTTQAVAGTGAVTTFWADAFWAQPGYRMSFDREVAPTWTTENECLIVSVSAPADALTLAASALIEEYTP